MHVSEGDHAAFKELFERYSAQLLRMMRRQIRSDEDARDLVQQTFLHLHRARYDFRLGSALRPWLFTIAMNLRREYFRRQARRPELLGDEGVDLGEEEGLGGIAGCVGVEAASADGGDGAEGVGGVARAAARGDRASLAGGA